MTKPLRGKPPRLSTTITQHIVLPSDANALGTIFGGRVMEWIDLAAAIAASRHANRVCVTASMDSLHFLAPIKVGYNVILKASVNYNHKTSLEIGVRVESENPVTGGNRHCASAYMTFVAINKKGKPVPVTPVLPETAVEKRRFREAARRRQNRLDQRQERLRTSKDRG